MKHHHIVSYPAWFMEEVNARSHGKSYTEYLDETYGPNRRKRIVAARRTTIKIV